MFSPARQQGTYLNKIHSKNLAFQKVSSCRSNERFVVCYVPVRRHNLVTNQKILPMTKYSLKELFHDPVSNKIELTRQIFALHGETLLTKPVLREQLANLAENYIALERCMAQANLAPHCKACGDKNESGGCCSRYMADENDVIQLLINLLTGGEVNDTRSDDDNDRECCFLNDTGCNLRYKPFFCLNYLCDTIRRTTAATRLNDLATATGRLLQAQYATEQILLTEIKGLPDWQPNQIT